MPISAHAGWAACAACTASTASLAPHSGTRRMASPVCGLVTVKKSLVTVKKAWPLTHIGMAIGPSEANSILKLAFLLCRVRETSGPS